MMIYVQASVLGPLQKVISHKYANGVISCMMVYVQTAILGPLQKVISHKYTNGVISYTMIYAQAAIFATTKKGGRRRAAILGPLWKEDKEEEKVNVPFKSLREAPLSGSFATSLRCTSAVMSLEDAEIGGT